MRGNVTLYDNLPTTALQQMQVHVELTHDIEEDGGKVDTCVNYDERTQCGGVGSWCVQNRTI